MVGDLINSDHSKMDENIIPHDWEIKELNTVSNIIDSLHQTPSFSESGFAMVRVTDIKSGNLNLEKVARVDEKTYLEFIRNYKPVRGDIVLSRVGSYGVTSFVDTDEPVCMGQNTLVIHPIIDNRFLYYILNSDFVRQQIENESFGTGYKSLSLKNVKELRLPIPVQEEEQYKIAKILSNMDLIIELIDKLIEKKKNIKQGAMQELLTGKKQLSGNWRSDLKQYKTEKELIPKYWQRKKIGETLKVKHGKSQRGVAEANGEYPILATGGEIGRTNQFLYNKPTVLIGRKGTIDEPQYMDSPFWSVDTLFYTEVFDNFNAKFLYYKMKEIDWYAYNEASGVPSLNAKTIEQIEISVPSTLAEQIAIAQSLSDMDTEIEKLEYKRNKFKQLKVGMMQQLLTGRIRLKCKN